MIPTNVITAWGVDRPWPNRAAIEQDLLLARLIVDIYNHPMLSEELVFRGGTCLHQVHLARPLRYSEDLDFVRRTHSGIGEVLDALREVAADSGLRVRGTDVGQHPKMRLTALAEEDGLTLRIKVEINTHETSPALQLEHVPFGVRSDWFNGQADVLTFAPAELVATKLRALFQRSKGRDLFDLWLALTQMGVAADDILAGFPPYRPEGYTSARAIENLSTKVADPTFRTDLDLLVTQWPAGYTIDTAADLVIDKLLSRV